MSLSPMRPGAMRHRVTIQALPADGTTDDYGAPSADWATLYASVPAAIQPQLMLRDRELIAAQQTVGLTRTIITIRYLPGVTVAMRVIDEQNAAIVYDIQDVIDPDVTHDFLQLLCASGHTQG